MATRNGLTENTRLGLVFWMLCLYFVFMYVRPHAIFEQLDPLRIPLMLSLLMPVLWLAKGDKRAVKDPLVILYVLFIMLCGVSVLWSANNFWPVEITKNLTVFLLAGTLPVAGLLQDKRRLRAFFSVWVLIHVLLALYALNDPDGRGTGYFLVDQNDLSLALNMAIPYAYFLMQSPERGKLFRAGMLVAIALMIAAIVNSDSRGGLVGLVVITAGILFTTQHRVRNALVIALIATVGYLNVPEGYVDEMATMADQEDATRYERLYSWGLGWHMYRENPLVGVGAGNYPWRVAEYEARFGEYTGRRGLGGRTSHSLYFTLIPELGTVGVLIYGSLVFLLFRRLYGVIQLEDKRAAAAAGKKRAARPTEAGLLGRAMMVSMLGLFSSGAFISVLYYPHLWFLIGFVLALQYTTQEAPEAKKARARARRRGLDVEPASPPGAAT